MADASTHWRFTFWLVFNKNGHIRQTIREPDVSRDERKLQMTVDLPKSLWSTPALKATVRVTEDNNEPSYVLDLQAAGDALRSALGVDVDIQIVPPAPVAHDNEGNSD
jgi:hypothetical protein